MFQIWWKDNQFTTVANNGSSAQQPLDGSKQQHYLDLFFSVRKNDQPLEFSAAANTL